MPTTATINPLRKHKMEILNRFLILNISTVIGVFFTLNLLGPAIILAPAFMLFTSISWIIAGFSFIYTIHNQKNIPTSYETVFGLLTGAFISSLIISTLIIDPLALIFASVTTGLVLIASFAYAKLSNQQTASHLRRHNILRSLGISAGAFLFISLGLVVTAVVTGHPIFIFIDAVGCGLLAGAGMVASMHYIIKEADGSRSPSADAFDLYLNTLDLFINLIRAYLASKNNNKKDDSSLSFGNVAKIGAFVFGSIYLVYLMASGKLFDMSETANQTKAVPSNRLRVTEPRICHAPSAPTYGEAHGNQAPPPYAP